MALSWAAEDNDGAAHSWHLRDRLIAADREWHVCLATECLTVLVAGSDTGPNKALLLESGAGIVLGTVFSRQPGSYDHPRALTHFSPPESQQLIAGNGKQLVDDYWGRYVAFIAGKEIRVLRDPVGALPCFSVRHQHVRIFFSSFGDLEPFDLPATSVNWQFIAAHMYQPRLLRCAQTGLDGFEEILPGQCWRLTRDGRIAKEMYWSPTTIARSGRLDTLPSLIQQIDDTTRRCVSAWASCYPRIVHLLSGGLDSSIVLRCIRYHPRIDVTALNFYNSFSSSSDERRYARLMSESVGCRLIEVEESPANADLRVILNAAPSVKPWGLQYYQTHTADERAITDSVGADAVFSGSGGDHIYLQGPVALAASDYAHDRGLDSYLIRLCFDIASIEGLTFASVIRGALRDGYGFRSWKPEQHVRPMRLTTSRVREVATDSGLLDPPWVEDKTGLAYGKLQHLLISTAVPHDFYHPFPWPAAPDRVSPLISQPLIELCLQTPTYLLAMGGQDRYLAREAFSNVLPEQIVKRRAKGTADAYMQRLITRNLDFARELLLDGLLVSNNLLDRTKLEQVLTADGGNLRPEAAEIVIFHLGTEAWLRRAMRK